MPDSNRLIETFQMCVLLKTDPAPKSPQRQGGSGGDLFDNGSYVVDHFSARGGAQTVTDFWEKFILVNGTKELLQEVGNYGMNLFAYPRY